MLGQSSTAGSLFGANSNTNTGSVFGSNTNTGFKLGGATNTGAFGTNTFGQNTSTSNAFGQNTSTPNAFGQNNSTPGTNVFGQSTTTPSTGTNLFGSSTMNPSSGTAGFGATSTGTNLFGNTGGSTSIFGNNPSTTSTFGNTSTSGGNLFGSTASTNTSLFGNAGTTNSLFGTQNNASFGQSNSSMQNNANQALSGPAIFTPQQMISYLQQCFDANSPYCRFRHIFYNVVAPTDIPKYVKPSNMEEKFWIQAQRDNPDPTRMVPVQASGFEDLSKRFHQQQQLNEIFLIKLKEVKEKIDLLNRNNQVDLQVKIDGMRKKQEELVLSLMSLLKKLQVLRLRNMSLKPEEEALYRKVESLVQHYKVTLLKSKLMELESTFVSKKGSGELNEVSFELDEESSKNLIGILEEEQKGISSLVQSVGTDLNEVKLIITQMK